MSIGATLVLSCIVIAMGLGYLLGVREANETIKNSKHHERKNNFKEKNHEKSI